MTARNGQGAKGTVVVTGGTAGVGRATAREFARAGYDVAILARGAAGLEGAADDVRRAGRRAVAVRTDVADADAVDEGRRARSRTTWARSTCGSTSSPVSICPRAG